MPLKHADVLLRNCRLLCNSRYDANSCEWDRSINYAHSRYFDRNADSGSDWMWLFEFVLGEVTGDAQLTVALAAMDAALRVYLLRTVLLVHIYTTLLYYLRAR